MSLSTGNVITVDSWLDLKAENRRLKAENAQLKAENERLKERIASMTLSIERATAKIDWLNVQWQRWQEMIGLL